MLNVKPCDTAPHWPATTGTSFPLYIFHGSVSCNVIFECEILPHRRSHFPGTRPNIIPLLATCGPLHRNREVAPKLWLLGIQPPVHQHLLGKVPTSITFPHTTTMTILKGFFFLEMIQSNRSGSTSQVNRCSRTQTPSYLIPTLSWCIRPKSSQKTAMLWK